MRKVLWTHTFSPSEKNSGVFMFQLIEPLRKQDIFVIPIYIGGIKSNPIKFFARLPVIYKQALECDIIHAQYGSMCGLLSILLPGKKLLSLRGSDWYGIAGESRKKKIHNFLARKFTTMSLPFYKKIIVMSNRMQKEVNSRYPMADVVAIPDGIDLGKFYARDKINARRQLELEENAKYILFTSACEGNRVKRAELALEAFKLAKEKMPSLHMMVAEKIDHNLMPIYINASDLTIITSIHEGWPNCIKEALACNVPFVATDVSDLREIAGKTEICKVVEADAEKISKAIIEVSGIQGEHNLRNFVNDMAIDNCANKLKIEYEKVMNN